MNWFTHEPIHSAEQAQSLLKRHDCGGCCEHVEADPSTAHMVSYENDSFGREGYIECEACYKATQEAAGEEEVVCDDCHQTVKKKDTIEWKWYDFYAAQGDEPVVVCSACREAEKHKLRVKRDSEDYAHENPLLGDDGPLYDDSDIDDDDGLDDDITEEEEAAFFADREQDDDEPIL